MTFIVVTVFHFFLDLSPRRALLDILCCPLKIHKSFRSLIISRSPVNLFLSRAVSVEELGYLTCRSSHGLGLLIASRWCDFSMFPVSSLFLGNGQPDPETRSDSGSVPLVRFYVVFFHQGSQNWFSFFMGDASMLMPIA